MKHTRTVVSTTAYVVALAALLPASAAAAVRPEPGDRAATRNAQAAQNHADQGCSTLCAVSADSAERRAARHPGDVCSV